MLSFTALRDTSQQRDSWARSHNYVIDVVRFNGSGVSKLLGVVRASERAILNVGGGQTLRGVVKRYMSSRDCCEVFVFDVPSEGLERTHLYGVTATHKYTQEYIYVYTRMFVAVSTELVGCGTCLFSFFFYRDVCILCWKSGSKFVIITAVCLWRSSAPGYSRCMPHLGADICSGMFFALRQPFRA